MAQKQYMVLFRSGVGVSCEAADPAAAVQRAKAQQRVRAAQRPR